ncbi:putative copper export protein [Pseudomonas sp. S3E17]|nr:putative copper export protein [Pseudomonas sp. S3E17]
MAALRRSMVLEMGGGALILALVAWLGTLAPN